MAGFLKNRRTKKKHAAEDDITIAKGPDSTGGLGMTGAPTVDETARDYDKRDRKRRRGKHDKDSMSSVLEEAVQEECLDVMRRNPAFDIERGGVRTHVCWGLAVEDIGGLSKKTSKDRNKGAIIEAINTSRIAAMTTQTLMDAGILVIIPTPETLEAANEFSLLADAPYRTFFVSDDGLTVDDDDAVEVTLNDARDVSDGDVTIHDLLKSKHYRPFDDARDDSSDVTTIMSPASGATVAPDDTASTPVAPVHMDDLDDIFGVDETPAGPQHMAPAQAAPEPASAPADEPQQFQQPQAQQPQQPQAQPQQPQPQQPQQPQQGWQEPAPQGPASDGANHVLEPTDSGMPLDDYDSDGQPVADASDGDSIDAEQMTGIVSHVWDDEDLGLELSIEPFEMQFDQPSKAYAPFDEDRGTGPLSDYLRQMSKEANADIAREHAANVDKLRAHYVALMASYITSLQNYYRLSSDGESSFVGRMQEVEETYNRDLGTVDEKTKAESARLTDAYEKQREDYAAGEAAKARQQYDKLYNDALNNRIQAARSDIQSQMDADHHLNRKRVLDDRRAEASKRLDYGINGVLMELQKEYEQMAASEQRTYERHRERIKSWIESNRSDEVAYAQTLAEAQRQADEADRVRAEWQRRLEDSEGDFERKNASLKSELDAQVRQSEQQLAAAREALATANSQHDAERASYEGRINDLLAKYRDLDDSKSKEYEAKLAAAKAEAEDAKGQLESSDGRTRHVMGLWVVITILVAVCALCLGMLFGTVSGINIMGSTSSVALPAAAAQEAPAND